MKLFKGGVIMATIYINLDQQDKDKIEFLVEVLNIKAKVNNNGKTAKVNQTSFMQSLIEDCFNKNADVLQKFETLGKFGALAEIEKQLRETQAQDTKVESAQATKKPRKNNKTAAQNSTGKEWKQQQIGDFTDGGTPSGAN